MSGFEDRCANGTCRSCGRRGLLPVLDLGSMPLADGLVPESRRDQPEAHYPLEVGFCEDCTLVQLTYAPPPEELFAEDYPYYSSFSDVLLAHSRKNALELIESRGLDGSSLVVELASNDGYLLKNFAEAGVPVLGIDPAPGPAKAAEEQGVPTLCEFFTRDFARGLADSGRMADVVIGNNVLAHVPDTNGFIAGIRTLLKDTGVCVVEAPYVRDLIDHCEFDTIYHEHHCYFSVTALDHLFRRNGLFVNEVRRLSIHGGSLRIYAEPVENPGESVTALLASEREDGVDRIGYYESFAARVRNLRETLRESISSLKAEGKRIAAYGAAAKGAVLLNYLELPEDSLDYVVDRNVHKHGRYMPGLGLRVEDPSMLAEDMPDVTLLLPWNFRDEIMGQQEEYRRRGGRFLIPIPTPEIV